MSRPARVPEFQFPHDAMLAGATVVEASAGTGKTWTIERIVLRRVLQGVPMPRLALMSFTRAAADELAERVRSTLHAAIGDADGSPEDRGLLEQALLDFDAACISTIHGFCQRMLQEHAAEAGVLGLAGWSLDPDAGGSERLALVDAYSATALQDPLWAELAPSPSDLADTLSKALEKARVRERVLGADYLGAIGRWQAAARAIHAAAGIVEGLREMAPHCNKAPREALEAAADALEAWRSAQVDTRSGAVAASRALEKVGAALWDEDLAVQNAPKRGADARVTIAKVHRARLAPHALALRSSLEAWTDACRHAGDSIVARALAMLAHRRAQRRQFDYHDLLHRLLAGLRAADGALLRAIRSRFDVAILDEFQDTDPVQAEIVRLLFRHDDAALYLVGDPKQSIYGFRSADLDSYIALRRTVDTRRSLSVSHRSDAHLVEAVNTLFAVPAPFFHDDVVAEPVTSAFPEPRYRREGSQAPAGLVLHTAPGKATVATCAGWVAQAVRRQLNEGWAVRVKQTDAWRPLKPSDVAVLCRTNAEMRILSAALRAWHVPCVLLGSDNVFASEMARDLACLLLGLARPAQRGLALGAAATRLVGLSQHDLAADPDGLTQRLRAAGATLDRFGVVAGLREALATVGRGLDGMALEPEGERQLSDVAQLLELLDEAERAGVRGAPALAAWMAEQVQGQRSGDEQAQKVRAISEHDAVTLQTLHGSKGLTYGVVWLPSAMRGGSADDASAGDSAAEARRLLYVGLTRARWQAHALWRHDAKHAHAALATLLHARGVPESREAEVIAKKRLREADFEEAIQDLRVVAQASSGAIEVRPIDEGPAGAPIEPACHDLAPVSPAPMVPPAAQQVSFTSLHGRFGDTRDDALDGVDRDDPSLRGADERGVSTACDGALRQLGISGTALGNLVHEALEIPEVFRAMATDGSAEPLARVLERGLPKERGATVADADRAASAIRAALGVTVAGIPSVAEAAALERGVFRELKLAAAWQGGLADLATAFELDPAPWSGAFARALREADGRALHGLIVGNIDLAVLSGDRWFLYDYKTNDFGRSAAAYSTRPGPDGLAPLDSGMIRSRYPLQAALYAALVRRWARARGCADRSSIGGVAYLFLRGIEPGHSGQGVWHWTPSERLLDALDLHLIPRKEAVS